MLKHPFFGLFLRSLALGLIFTSWVQLLYSHPLAVIREAGQISDPFSLGRGTHQGCLLSQLLFTLAMEPLAACVRQNPCINGFQFWDLQESVMLYADDTMLLLGDASLEAVMRTGKWFGEFSGLLVN